MTRHHWMDCPVHPRHGLIQTPGRYVKTCKDCDLFLDPQDEIMPQSRIVTCRYYHQVMGWCGCHFETTLNLADIVEVWRQCRAKDDVVTLPDSKTGAFIGFPAIDILRYEVYEGYHELTVDQ